jgi:hypothetical protein
MTCRFWWAGGALLLVCPLFDLAAAAIDSRSRRLGASSRFGRLPAAP